MKSKKKITMDPKIKELLSNQDFLELNRVIKIKDKEYFPKKHLSSSGFKSTVWQGNDQYSMPVVIKLATYEDYLDRAYIQELSLAAKLRNYQHFAQLYDAGIIKLKISENEEYKVVCFIEEWVDGVTLAEFMENNEIGSSFVLNYVNQMAEILNILKTNNLRHDDLHKGNVMIANPQRGVLSQNLQVKVVDLGSLKNYNQELKKEKDDLGRLTEHIIELSNRMVLNRKNKRKPLNLIDRKFREEIIPLINSMLEEDIQVALNDPSVIGKRFEDAYERAKNFQNHKEEKILRIEDPFDYISAEHISDDKLLVKLFAESCPWIKEVTSPNPILLTGPRGCGKSMAFRWMSLKALLYKEDEYIKNSQIAGFYISCSADLRNRFGWISSPPLAKKYERTIVHYFNLLLCKEIIQTLSNISRRTDRETLFGFGELQERNLHEFLITRLTLNTEMLKLQGIKPLEHIEEIVELEMNQCYELFLKGRTLECSTYISFISDLTRYMTKNIRYFREKIITFLIDDYSVHRISEPIQKILNPIIWDRQPTHIFKLSSEKYGTKILFDNDYNIEISAADNTREFREIDCGQSYIGLNDKKSVVSDLIDFSKELLDHRLSLAGYEGNSELLIGTSSYDEGNLAKSLVENPRKQDHYHGISTIAQLCSGDISAILEIYREIFNEGKVNKNSKKAVNKISQNKAIKKVSRRFFSTIRKYHPYGKEMHRICLCFGVLCKQILYDGRKINLKGKETFNITTRIEVDQKYEEIEDWSEDKEILMKELLRRSVFIELEPSRGRNTFGPTMRWQLRRIYCPTFGLPMTKNVAIKWSVSDFKYFIGAPEEACDKEWKSRWSKLPSDQSSLYSFYGEFENDRD